MTVLRTRVDPSTPEYAANRAALLEQLAAELGETEAEDEILEPDATSGTGGSRPKRARRRDRNPGLRDRLRDAIS